MAGPGHRVALLPARLAPVKASEPVPGQLYDRAGGVRLAGAVVGFSLFAVTGLEGQLHSVPNYGFSAWPPGVTLAAEYGRDVTSAEAVAQHLGLRGYYRSGRIGVGGTAGLRSAGRGSDLQSGGNAALRLWSPLGEKGALSLETGVGYLASEAGGQAAEYLSVPLGLSLGLGEFALHGRRVRPWVAARVQGWRVRFARALLHQYGGGASAGMAVDLLGVAGLHLAADWSSRGERRLEGAVLLGGMRFTLGVGLYANFRLGDKGG